MERRLLVGTNNTYKAREISALLEGLAVTVVTPRDLGIGDEPREDGATFQANALAKARFFASRAALPCLADDSGLEVAALGGRPGVLSSRYAPTDAERITRLLDELRGVEPARRTARFVCAVALVVSPAGPEIVEVGVCEGRIALEPRGSGGFGYDPVFEVGEGVRTMAELSPSEKNATSHRGRALAAMRPHLLRLFALPESH